jgi:hypothetical protein
MIESSVDPSWNPSADTAPRAPRVEALCTVIAEFGVEINRISPVLLIQLENQLQHRVMAV